MMKAKLKSLHLKMKRYLIQKKYKKYLYPEIMPETIRIDASTNCQLRCEGCGFQNSNHRGLSGGFLKAKDFEKVLLENPQLKRVELSNYGEIFLNPELIDIMRIAYEHSIKLEASMGVNFNTVTLEQLEALVKYQFHFISISIDGASQETYSKYRRGGNFDVVMDNIKKLQEIKKKYQSQYPKLRWQFVLNQYDEQDIPKAKQIAKELNIPMMFRLNFLPSYKPTNEEMVRKETGLDCITREEYAQKYHIPYTNEECERIFTDPQFNFDGTLLGCSKAEENYFGVNLFKDGLKKSLHAPKFIKMKELVLSKNPRMEDYRDLPCYKSQLQKTRIKYGKTLEPKKMISRGNHD